MSLYRSGGGGGPKVYTATINITHGVTQTITCGFKPSMMFLQYDAVVNLSYTGFMYAFADGRWGADTCGIVNTGASSAPVFTDTGVTFGCPIGVVDGTVPATIVIIGE